MFLSRLHFWLHISCFALLYENQIFAYYFSVALSFTSINPMRMLMHVKRLYNLFLYEPDGRRWHYIHAYAIDVLTSLYIRCFFTAMASRMAR